VTAHPVATLLADAAGGRFPPVDGSWHRVPTWRDGVEAVLAFTGHAVLALRDDVTDDRLGSLDPDGFGGAHHPRVLTALAGPDGWVDSLDAVLVARGTGGTSTVVDRPDLADHPRVRHAREIRDDVRVLGPATGRSLLTVSRGLGGLPEVSLEVDATDRGAGLGRSLFAAALTTVPDGTPVVASVAPGNAASLRAALAAGYVPVASVQLFRRS
jgi:hypothetical protein